MRSSSVVAGQNGVAQQFTNLRHDAKGGSFLLAHQQLGALALPTNPSNSNTLTLTINGTAITITFVSSIGATAGNVLIGASATATLANLIALLNQPQTTTSTGVALSTANQQFVSYLTWPLAGTTITPCSSNTSLYAPLSSLSVSTTVSGGIWTAQKMQLYIEPGVVYVSGTRVIFAGGSTPTVTAPSVNPRIDVLTIDNTGTLAWTTGTESATPSAPTYPANKVPLCELYNVVGETALYDNANHASAQGYISNDVRAFMQPSMNWAAFTSDLIPDADGTRNLGSGSKEWNNIYAKTAVYVNGIPIGSGKFGGTGADGALSISSGTTTIDCANVAVVVKNYTSISITGSGKLAFINPNTNGTVIILKSQGGVTLTSSSAPMIDASGMGAAGALGSTSNVNAGGNTGGNGYGLIFLTNGGVGPANVNVGGLGGAAINSVQANLISPYLFKYASVFVGAGGGGGDISQGGGGGGGTAITSGGGGLGGGGLIIECAGAWDFTTASGISVAAQAGGNATGGNPNVLGGGGGGGAGGFFLALYGTLTANTGTVTISGGAGGLSSSAGLATSVGGGGGGGSNTAGSAGISSSGTSAITGGGGATGIAIIAQNTEYD
jgi:hypothetical protein